ncbi:MAG TPA: DUF2254 domain-containing protein [Polyangia bacterium]|jgi:uncharacterized membrane protein
MRLQLLKYAGRLRASFWFLPSLMATGAIAAAFGMVALDQGVTDKWVRALGWAYSGGAQGASAVLQTIAGSMITIAGVVFSLTLVALSLASSQFGSRLLRSFMRDTMTQVVLGTFVATFLYCLLVLRTIRRAEESLFVPHLSVTLGVVFAIASLWVLIYFIHHVAVSIQADEIVARVGENLAAGIDRLFPEQTTRGSALSTDDAAGAGMPSSFETEAETVESKGDGYLQIIDMDALVLLARQESAVFRIERRPGQYVIRDHPLVSVWPAGHVTEALDARINAAFVLGNQRTSAQDIEFDVQELVEIAVRALSPGINDPFTAIVCVDRLGSALSRLVRRDTPSPYRLDGEGQLRVIAPPADFAGIVDSAFNQIRQYARTSVGVTLRLLEAIAAVADAAGSDERRVALQRHADMVVRGAREALPESQDRLAVEERYGEATKRMRRHTTRA